MNVQSKWKKRILFVRVHRHKGHISILLSETHSVFVHTIYRACNQTKFRVRKFYVNGTENNERVHFLD